MQIINDSSITGSDGAITYINGVEMCFKDIPEIPRGRGRI